MHRHHAGAHHLAAGIDWVARADWIWAVGFAVAGGRWAYSWLRRRPGALWHVAMSVGMAVSFVPML